jgi:hypothetical protein
MEFYHNLTAATQYQVDQIRSAYQVYLIPNERTHYQVDLTGGPGQVYLPIISTL